MAWCPHPQHPVTELELLEMAMPTYHQRPLFDQTIEPAENGLNNGGSNWPLFVVKKHHATRLHYDFRLEHAGVLKSWAVPLGPCLDPSRKRLAVLVNDHRIEYFGFEGTIPPGRYGAGTVMLWDRGIWRTDQDVNQALRHGQLKFELRGEKLKGSWLLVRMQPAPGDNREKWLLSKDHDTEAKSLSEMDVLVAEPLSIATGRSLPEIAAKSTRSPKSKKPDSKQPPLFPDDLEP
jgi:bifunctional non-homologous end joining protein LigD